jgi:hypothetical protein
MPQLLYLQERDPVPIVQEAGWVWKTLPPLGFEPSNVKLEILNTTVSKFIYFS